MEQKARFRSLVFSCIVVLLALVAIQLYLLRNTYRLSLANYHSGITTGFTKFQSDTGYKKVELQYIYNLMDCAGRLNSGKVNETAFRALLRQKDQKVSEQIDSILKLRALKRVDLKDIRQHAAYTSITIRGTTTSFNPVKTSDSPLTVTLPEKANTGVISLGESTGTAERTGTNGELHIAYSFSRTLEVPALPPDVIRQLTLVGGLSVVLLIAVVSMVYCILVTAQRQRKIAELRADLVNNITHELKTPLSSMAIVFKTLNHLGYNTGTSQQIELMAALERQHQKLNQTVERVLESAMHRQTHVIVNLDIASLLKEYQQGIISENHQVSFSFDSGPCYVKGIKGLIEAVLDNLIENAQKYTEPGSPVQVTGKPGDNRYCIHVADSGKGIAKEYQKHLFEKFYRVPENNLHSVKGLGLGLYLVRQAAKNIGGDVQLTSSSPSGSVFTLILPLA